MMTDGRDPRQNIRQAARILPLLACALALAGCLSSVLPEPEASRLYHLPAPALSSSGQPTELGLVVDEPSVAPALESDRLIAVANNGEVQRVGGARWVGPPARLVQDGLVQRLRQLGVVRSVDARALRFTTSLRLAGELQALQYQPDSGSAHVALTLHLVCTTQARSLGQRSVAAEVPSSAEADAIVAALARGLDQIAGELADWIAAHASECSAAATPTRSDGFESRADD